MASTTRTGGYAWGAGSWPASRVLAVLGAVLGLIMALALLGGALLGIQVVPATDGAMAFLAGVSLLAVMGVVHLVVAGLAMGSAWFVLNNPRLHGGLLILWGILGLFLGFGFWIGAVLLLVGGILAIARAPSTRVPGRPPVA